MGYRKTYKKKSYTRKRRIPKTKKLVTGQQQPTFLEQLASGAGAVANVAKAVLPIVSMINTEAKYVDKSGANTIPIGTPWIQCLSSVAQGTDENNRIGNSILCKNLNIRISIIPNFTSQAYNLVRFILFCDKQQSGTPPTAALLLTNSGNIDSPFNRNYSDRFVIIKDKRVVISQQGQQTGIFHKMYKQLDFHTRYIGTSAADASLGNNQIYLLAVSTEVTNSPTFYLYSRLNFTDN